MRAYLLLFKKKIYFGFLVILSCACLGSIRGAWKETKEGWIGVTPYDISIMQQDDSKAPDLIGIIPLAAEQNRWHNFGYALAYARRGFILYCLLLVIYLPMYHFRFFEMIRKFIGKNEEENNLFIDTDCDI